MPPSAEFSFTLESRTITLPRPFTMSQQATNEFYRDIDELAVDFAVAVNEKARELQAAGADVRDTAFGKLRALSEGARTVRARLA